MDQQKPMQNGNLQTHDEYCRQKNGVILESPFLIPPDILRTGVIRLVNLYNNHNPPNPSSFAIDNYVNRPDLQGTGGYPQQMGFSAPPLSQSAAASFCPHVNVFSPSNYVQMEQIHAEEEEDRRRRSHRVMNDNGKNNFKTSSTTSSAGKRKHKESESRRRRISSSSCSSSLDTNEGHHHHHNHVLHRRRKTDEENQLQQQHHQRQSITSAAAAVGDESNMDLDGLFPPFHLLDINIQCIHLRSLCVS